MEQSGVEFFCSREPVAAEQQYAMLTGVLARLSLSANRAVPSHRVDLSALMDLVIQDYKIAKKLNLKDLEYRIEKNLRQHWFTCGCRHSARSLVDRDITEWQADGAAEATVNRESAILRRAFSLGTQMEPPMVHKKSRIRVSMRTARVRASWRTNNTGRGSRNFQSSYRPHSWSGIPSAFGCSHMEYAGIPRIFPMRSSKLHR